MLLSECVGQVIEGSDVVRGEFQNTAIADHRLC